MKKTQKYVTELKIAFSLEHATSEKNTSTIYSIFSAKWEIVIFPCFSRHASIKLFE